jgi:protein TonB
MPLPPPPVVEKPRRVSRMMDGLLIHRVQPDYPNIAKQAGIQGAVVIAALIGKEGVIENLHVLNGHPLLIPAAVNAVKQWRYRPYILNGDPIEVDTQITVKFSLSGN